MSRWLAWAWACSVALGIAGCTSPYYADRGALIGGVGGAGVGAAIGEASGHPLAGALIGAGVGTLTGAAIGSGMDEMEAKNRALIESKMARQIPKGAVTVQDVTAMSQAGVEDSLIITHIKANGVAQRLQATDLIALRQAGVSPAVVQAMETTSQNPPATTTQAAPQGGTVIVEQRVVPPPPYPPPPYWGPPPYRRWGPPPPPPPPAFGWGVSVGGVTPVP